jgi:hypothetical protein
MEVWIWGFLSGVNYARGGVPNFLASKLEPAALYAVIDNYCRANPLERLEDGAISLANELAARAKADR